MHLNVDWNVEVFIRHFMLGYLVFFNSFYAFVKTQNINLSIKRVVTVFVINVFSAIIYSILAICGMVSASQIVSYAGIILSLLLLTNKEQNNSLIIGLICTCYSHILKLAGYYISSVIIYLIFGPVLNLFPYVMTCIISIGINILFMRIKRLRNGIRFFEKSDNLGLGLVISGLVFFFSLTGYEKNKNEVMVFIVAVCILIVGFGLYLWIKKSITKHYRENQQLKSELYYKEQLENIDAEIEKLNCSNEYLSKVVHRDNHLMSSL